jgi:molybdopterin-guanine dinucleotide biosynthesis protein A
MKCSVLVLAGGEAKRFQTESSAWKDKALAKIDDKPFLVHIIENLQGAVDKVAVSVNSPERQAQYRQVLEKYSIKDVEFVLDQLSPIRGPLLAITSGLKAVNAEYTLVVPTDMPFLQPKVANHLLEACRGFDVAVPMWPDGTLETLLMALRRESCLEITETLLALGKANADSILRAAGKLHLISPLQEISLLDPALQSFININTPTELTKPQTRSTQGPVTQTICFDRGLLPVQQLKRLRDSQKMLDVDKSLEALSVFGDCACKFESEGFYFWAAVSEEKLAQTQISRGKNFIAKQTYKRAAENYAKEALLYHDKGCTTLAERALADKEFCNVKATP